MRKSNKKIDKAVLETMDLLETLPQEKPREGFYERLTYRLEHDSEQPVKRSGILQIVGAPVAVAACVGLGILLGINRLEVSGDGDLDVLVNTYNMSVSESVQIADTEG